VVKSAEIESEREATVVGGRQSTRTRRDEKWRIVETVLK